MNDKAHFTKRFALFGANSFPCCGRIVRLSLAALIACIVLNLSAVECRAETPARSVLILDESGPGGLNPGYLEISKAFRDTLAAKSPTHIYAMNLDLHEFSGPRYSAALRTYVREKFRDIPVGVVLALGSSALEIALQLRPELWPNVPIVFAAADEDSVARIAGPLKGQNITGRVIRFSLAKTIEIAQRLVPDLRQIVLVGDPLEKQPFRQHFKDDLPQLAGKFTLTDLTGQSLSDVSKQVAKLPSDAVIVYTAITTDGTGATYLPYEAVQVVAKSANRPILIDIDNRIGRGGTGGLVVRPALLGTEAAQLVLRLFNGEAAAEIGISPSEAMRPVFDARQLNRWGIDESSLPPGSEVLFREVSVWEQYKLQIIMIVLTVLFQSGLIAGLLYEDRRRRSAEARSLALSTDLAHVNRVATAGELAASLAHEIRQPLAAIVARGNAGLNWLNRTTPDLEKVQSALQNIVDNGHRADEVLRNTRAMFRKEDAPQVSLNVNRVIKEVLALTASRVAARHIMVVTSYVEDPLPIVRANRVQLQQVLLNLIMNAIDAMSTTLNGSRILTLATEINQSGHVLIMVRDTGPGIASDQLDLIFKSFFTTKPGGMGVGLAICKTIVESHGGVLKAIPGVPTGMLFTIELPLKTRSPRVAPSHEAAAEGRDALPHSKAP